MEAGARVRFGVVPACNFAGMGSVSLWPLGLDLAVGMDLGGRCDLGICAIPLWPLGFCRRRVGMGAVPATGGGGSLCAADLRACAGCLGGRPALCGWNRICGRR